MPDGPGFGIELNAEAIKEGRRSNDRPGYRTTGRLFAIGYIRGLIQSTYGTS